MPQPLTVFFFFFYSKILIVLILDIWKCSYNEDSMGEPSMTHFTSHKTPAYLAIHLAPPGPGSASIFGTVFFFSFFFFHTLPSCRRLVFTSHMIRIRSELWSLPQVGDEPQAIFGKLFCVRGHPDDFQLASHFTGDRISPGEDGVPARHCCGLATVEQADVPGLVGGGWLQKSNKKRRITFSLMGRLKRGKRPEEITQHVCHVGFVSRTQDADNDALITTRRLWNKQKEKKNVLTKLSIKMYMWFVVSPKR